MTQARQKECAAENSRGLEYFPHDTGASCDVKLEPLLMLYGGMGYAFYFLHLEHIYRSPDFTLQIADPKVQQILRRKLKLGPKKYREILEAAFAGGCFDKAYYEQTGCLTSTGIRRRGSLASKRRESIRSFFHSKNLHTNSDTISDIKCDTKCVTKHDTHRDTKNANKDLKNLKDLKDPKNLKDQKNDHSSQNAPSKKEAGGPKPDPKIKFEEYVTLTKAEHQKLIDRFGAAGAADWIQRLNLYKGSKGKKYNSDYLTILNWERREKAGQGGNGDRPAEGGAPEKKITPQGPSELELLLRQAEIY